MLFDVGLFTDSEGFVAELVEVGRASAAVGFAGPLAFDGVDLPVFGEDFVDGNTVELEHKIAETHPPGSIRLLSLGCILNILFHRLILFPIISLFTKRPCPDSFTPPWVSQPDQPQIILGEIPHINNGIVMILQNALLTLLSILKILLAC